MCAIHKSLFFSLLCDYFTMAFCHRHSCMHVSFRYSDDDIVQRNFIFLKTGSSYSCKKCKDDGLQPQQWQFNSPPKANRHIDNHLEEKKYVCCFCDSQFNNVDDMKRHVTPHTGEI